MDHKIPFTSYDFWAYLSAGFLLLVVVDHVGGTGLLVRESWTIVQGVVAVAGAYAVGQLVASVSSALLERVVVGKLLGHPRDVLFGRPKAWRWVRKLMPGYFTPLPDETQRAVLARGDEAGIAGPGEALFWAAFGVARSNQIVMNRLADFLNLYGFCRNVALVSLVNAVVLRWSYWQKDGPVADLYWSWVALAVGVGMTFRYLKFFRHYAVEVFTAYAHNPSAGAR